MLAQEIVTSLTLGGAFPFQRHDNDHRTWSGIALVTRKLINQPDINQNNKPVQSSVML